MNTISVHPIHTQAEYFSAMARINVLAEHDPSSGTPEFDELEVWSLIVRHYEDECVPLEHPSIKDVVEFRADQMGLSTAQLDTIFGGSGRRSEVLSGKRALSKAMAARLKVLGVPDAVLVQLLLDRESVPQGEYFSRDRTKHLGKARSQEGGSIRVRRESKTGTFVATKGKRKTQKRLLAKR